MKTFNVHEAKTHFSSILALVAAGEDVLVAKAGTPMAVISAYRKSATRRAPGLFKIVGLRGQKERPGAAG